MPEVDAAQRLTEMYDTYGVRLYRYALVLVQRQRDAEDVVQNVFVRLAGRTDGDLREMRNVTAYLFQSVRNEAATCLRRRRRSRARETDLGAAEYLIGADGVPADGVPADDERRRRITHALGRLGPEQREVVALHAFEALTFAEIAALLGHSPHTVASRYRLGVAKLARWLREG